ncbi:MAG: 7-carboxy-7-deazaguanine synthase [Gammaproteobacteria bacterium]|nr:7-carboxy-7-deazaguanine synthase [Gammaproteobacteria bacterium]MBI5619325.1 7-carboxy-7-deazaguanine synthase [Gammaproteobacteria bacterium]
MSYAVKEIFHTLQGEGAQAGRAAVFCRFAGCNLWSGLERDRAAAACTFCDTDFVGTDGEHGGRYADAAALAAAISAQWRAGEAHRYVVLTGGEPLLQVDEALVTALHAAGFEIAVETNGTCAAPAGIDWICVSPKGSAALVQRTGQELKLVHPQAGVDPESFSGLAFDHFFLQPMDGVDRERNTARVVEYCRTHPRWRMSVQMHKVVGIP